jgi:NSS family neurotransmitter:Na+ symporter
MILELRAKNTLGEFMASNASAQRRTSLHGEWSSRFAFILAVSGSAVGLGNVWKFPYIAGEYGGGAFVLFYLFCVFLVGLPIMVAEISIGRRGRRNPVATMALLGEEESGSTRWRYIGLMGVVAGILILSFYSVVAGWAAAYIFKAGSNVFVGADSAAVSAQFDALTGDPVVNTIWHTLFMAMTIIVVANGVERGLEKAVRVLMPALLALLLVLLGYSMVAGDFVGGLMFMFEPRVGELTADGALVALGHACFTLSVGMGAVMAYGAYLPDEHSIGKTSCAIVIADTAIALLAGLVIFPIVFAYGLDPAIGPGLIFHTLPLAFGQLPGGAFVGTAFFVLLTFAAWTSAISLMEPGVAWLIESYRLSRVAAAWSLGVFIWLLGFLSAFSTNVLSGLSFWRGTFFDNLDYLTANIMLPLGGMAIVFFAGWVMSRNSTADEIDPSAGLSYQVWRFLARFVAPVAVLLVFLHVIGLLEAWGLA